MTAPALRERPRRYDAGGALPESALTALWLLGRVPAAALPWPLLRAGRAGRGPGPDVREATVLLPSGVTRTGDVEVHLRATDFTAHGHAEDPAYASVILHLCWEDDRPQGSGRGAPTPLPGGGLAPTVALQPWLRTAARVEALVARGLSGPLVAAPCADAGARLGTDAVAERVRAEGRRRLAERAWRAWRLVDRYGVDGAFDALLLRALAATAGRRREDGSRRAALAAAVRQRLGPDLAAALTHAALTAARATDGGAGGGAHALIAAVRVDGLGAARAAEVAWNSALPLLAALAAAYDDLALARATAGLAERWPAPRPYGRTRTLAALAGPAPRAGGGAAGGGALYAQGLLHLQDLWCTRGGCGACPLST